MMTEHEADRTTSLMIDSVEARACITTGDMLARLVTILRGLTLNAARMRANLDRKAVDALLDPTAYTGLCGDIARQAATRARDAVARAKPR